MTKNKSKGWRGQSKRHAKSAKGIKTGRKKIKRHIQIRTIDDIVKNYGSFPKIEERLGKRKKEALMTAGDVKIFFRQYPEYRLQARGVETIKLLEDRQPSMEMRKEAKYVPGMYLLPPKKEIRLFPIEPRDIPEGYKERAKKFYTSKEQFPAALVHEITHHHTMPKELIQVAQLSDEEISALPPEKIARIERLKEEQEILAEKAEDTWLDKMRRRQR